MEFCTIIDMDMLHPTMRGLPTYVLDWTIVLKRYVTVLFVAGLFGEWVACPGLEIFAKYLSFGDVPLYCTSITAAMDDKIRCLRRLTK